MATTATAIPNRPVPFNRRVWLALAAPPLIFLLVIVAASVYFGATLGADPDAIAAATQTAMPSLLVVVQVSLAGLVFWALRAEGLSWRDLGWRLPAGQTLARELALGGGLGAALGIAYVFGLAPLMALLQRTLGDYVPPDQLLPTLGSALPPFFVANVLLAPLVEEALYRGYALPRLAGRFGPRLGLMLACVFFGLLHWTGGFWYIVLTGVVAGGLLGGLFTWRRTLLAPLAAHLALNIVEFVFIALASAG